MGKSRTLEDHLIRRSAVWTDLLNDHGVDARLLASADVPIGADGVEQALTFLGVAATAADLSARQRDGQIAPFFGEAGGRLRRVVLTPDLHKGGGIPIGTVAETEGFVIPQAVGNDVCCGMRLLVTDLAVDDVLPHLDALERRLRAIFFEGGRDIPMSPRQREALLREGLSGLWETAGDNAGEGIWRLYDRDEQEAALAFAHGGGGLLAEGTYAFGDFIEASGRRGGRDSQIGSIGGGNHFVELQRVDAIGDGAIAHAWGVRPGQVAIMVHSGSVGLGHMVGRHFLDQARAIYPGGVPHADHGFYMLPTSGPHGEVADRYLDAMANAANFAFGNRLMLGLMVVRALSEAVGREVEGRLIHDVPHNLIWPRATPHTFLHRKGACPALGPEPEREGPFRYTGHPVVIPGSMGSASFLMAGRGSEDALCSACHGAGRALSRGRARHIDEATFEETIAPLRVVTPVDIDRHEIRRRPEIVAEHRARLKEEGPLAYKPITPVIETVEEAGVAGKVARLWPLLTVKG